ncbi:LysR family transcriptional regulator [Nonomuraea sp. NPDC049400]|uniref:LysR family transcriptional regulator n=1 Tax=Nonomuraea sp. NPDC049400 TaxID=3364352 RepID=UPI0037ACE636
MLDGPRDLDLRKLRYFVAVAERLHFGQAALALHVTQPALSRQVRQLERDLGVVLFSRTSREVKLTPAGEQFLHDARGLLAAGRAAQDRARRIGAGERTLTVGFMLGTDVTAALNAFSAGHPDVPIELVRIRWWNQAQPLLDGTVEVGFVRLPVDSGGLGVLPLYPERLSVVLPARHPLAGESGIRITALAGEPVLQYADATPAWAAVWNAVPRPDGTRPPPGPAFHDMEELLGYVTAGRGVVLVPEPVAALFPRPDIAYVPVTDVPPGEVALAWDDARRSTLVSDFVEAARSTSRLRSHGGRAEGRSRRTAAGSPGQEAEGT